MRKARPLSLPMTSSRRCLLLALLAPALLAGGPDVQVTDLPGEGTLVALGDVDGDGHLDLVAEEYALIHVLPGDGLGGFGAPVSSTKSFSHVGDLRLADFDGDGRADVGTIASGNAVVYLSIGGGALGPAITVPDSLGSVDAVFADVTGDGRDDVVTAAGAIGFRLHRSLPGGAFAPAVTVAGSGSVQQVALADVDGNGTLDVFTQQSFGVIGKVDVYVHVLQPGGGFAPAVLLAYMVPEGNSLYGKSLFGRDMDGDGLGDVLYQGDSGWVLRRSLGGGAFAAEIAVTDAHPGLVFDERGFTDVDGDGLTDILLRGISGPSKILMQGPDHTFEVGKALYVLNSDMALPGDMDEDGAVDRVVSWDVVLAPQSPEKVHVFSGDSSGALRTSWVDGLLINPQVVDADLDGYPDLLSANPPRLARGRSGGRIGPFEDLGLAGGDSQRAVDMDGNGLVDLVTSWPSGSSAPMNELHVALASTPATWTPDASPLLLPLDEKQYGLDVGDLDGDGDADVGWLSNVSPPGQHRLRSVLNDGAGELSVAFLQTAPDGSELLTLQLGDMDGDGDLDALVASRTLEDLRTALGAGDGSFGALAPAVPSGDIGWLNDAVLADSNGDGILDLHGASTSISGTWGLLRLEGLGDGSFGPVTLTTTESADLLFGLVAGDADADGDVDVFTSGNGLALCIGDGAGGFSAHTVFRGPGDPRPGKRGTLSDIDGDGILDYMHSGFHGWVVPGAGPWTSLGHSLAGAAGYSRLTGAGPLTAGSVAELLVEQAPPGANGILVVGLSELSAPFKGGVMVPFPDALRAFSVDASGEALLAGTWPAGVPSGAAFFAQSWLPGTPFAATTAVTGVAP